VKPVWFVFAAVVVAFVVKRRDKLEPTLVVGGLIAAAAATVYGTGVVELPNLDKVLEDIGKALGPWTYLLVAFLAFGETGAFIGLLLPGETAIIVGGVVAGQGEINLVALIAIVWAMALAGDLTSFMLGRRLGRGFLERHGPRVHITEERLQQVERFFDRHGGKAIFLGRFVGIIRAVLPFMAGSSGMPVRRFLPYDILGAGIWGSTFCVLGYLFWQSIDQVIAIAKTGALALGGTITVVAALVFGIRWLRVDENRAKVVAWIDAHAPFLRRLERPARFTWNRLTPGQLGLELTTLLAIAAVGAFVFLGYATVLDDATYHTPGDVRGVDWSASLHAGWLVSLAKAVSWLGALPVAGGAAALTGVALLVRRHTAEGLALLAGIGLTYVGVHVMKDLLDRPRPAGSLVDTAGSAYPSGHAAYAVAWVAVALALRHALPRTRVLATAVTAACVLAVLIALSRVYLRAHWFSDVAGGLGLGAMVFAACGIVVLVVGHLRQTSPES
jgi:membrane protein DedA with SNARE-associated domain/membrane-associated phospholipid phosphatase